NTAPQDSMGVRAMVTRYLKALTPQTRMAVYHMSKRLTVLHDFTDDFESLRARVQKSALALPLQHESDFDRSVIEAEQFVNMFAGDPQMQAMMEEVMRNQLEVEMMMDAAARRRRLELTLVTMEALGRHLEGIPGRKSLIWISGGISIISVTGAMGFGPRGGIESYEDKIRRTSQRLAQQGVVLYIVDAKGLTLPNWMSAFSSGAMPVRGRGRFEPQQDAVNMSTDPLPAMNLMASTTGGRFLHNTNDLLAGFSRAASDLRGSYTLGFCATEEPDRKWHKVSVRVSRRGVNVRHRQGYLADAPTENRGDWTPESWNAVISNPIGSTAVLVTASAVALKESGNVRIALRIEPSSLHFRKDGDFLQADIQITVADKAIGGAARRHTESASVRLEAARWAAAARAGLAWGREWKPLEEAVMARVIVRDMTTGQYGTLDVPLKKIPGQ
ncbi:MAG: VWA domain-containing protein, partial [Bryobacteraceae bacterium]